MKQSNNKDAEQSQSNAITLRVSAVANEPAALKLHEGEYGSAAEQARSNAMTLHVSAGANEPTAIKLPTCEYGRAAEQARRSSTTKMLSRAKQCNNSARQRSCQ